MKQFHSFFSYLLSLAWRLLIAVLVGALLLTMVYCIPTTPVEKNLAISAEVFDQEGVYPQLYSWCTSQLDNFTDALMLLHAGYDSGESALQQAMSVKRGSYGEDIDPSAAFLKHYRDGVPFASEEPYYQYWHGYLVFVKPLLTFLSYQNIRLVNGGVQLVLFAVLVLLMVRRNMKAYILPYAISITFLMPVTLAMSLQFSTCYYLLTLGAIALLLKKDPSHKDGIFFLWLGIATAYLDFLTYPIVTLGVPAVFYFCLCRQVSFRDTFCRGVKICFSWAVGYGGMWASKWLLGSLIVGGNVLSAASAAISERSSLNVAQGESLLRNMYAALSVNVKSFLTTPALFLAAAAVMVLLLLIVRSRKRSAMTGSGMANLFFPFVVLALLPVAWYLVLAQHSLVHHWFTCKALVVSAFAGLCALAKLQKTLSVP